jgi:hypothetical protein
MSTVQPDVLGEIKEKNMTHVSASPPKALTRQAFPEPFVRDEKVCLLLVYGNHWSVTEMNYYISKYRCSETEILNLCTFLSLKRESPVSGHTYRTFNFTFKYFIFPGHI